MRKTQPSRGIGRTLVAALAVSAAAIALVGCSPDTASSDGGAGAGDGGAEITDIKVGRNPGGFEATILADTEGFFEKHGLKAEISLGGDPTTQIASLVSGDLDIAMTGGPDIARAVAQGIPVSVISGAKSAEPDFDGEPTDGLLLPPGSPIKDWSDLEGKTVGIQGLGSLPQLVNNIALTENGVDPATVSYVNLPVDTLMEAAKSGTVDAILPFSVFFLNAVDQGFEKMGMGAREFLPGAPQIVWAASDSYIAANPGVIEAFVAAMDEASQFAGENPEAVRDVYREYSKFPEDFIANRMVLEPLTVVSYRDAWTKMLDAQFELGDLDHEVSVSDVLLDSAP
ncbi:NitT/TauT family transport system substrate-binding protein [Homoserinimonas aerilata]|uniref:NitT/TauT family transport system substrate-binding protein n=1 Tax=Homoserinimonas aerilata TaxID=1162970 RepID=A0A542YJY8_9MICO|nr:ABC transporter substrate-binding protein [Homoserinimonas aerilata]TQL48399.1 NitT/TauT family transport system substrate-binding protein [Homoserinimonas aerilata]